MKIAFIMDPLEGVKAYKDTTYFMMLAAQERGHQVSYLDQRHLFAQGRRVLGRLTSLRVSSDIEKPFSVGDTEVRDLAEMDLVFVRTDPPFDRRYFYTTLLLDLLPTSTRVVNRPAALRNWNEKLSALFFPEWIPETLVSSDADQILAFMDQIGGRITLKPIDGHGGRGIVFLEPDDINRDQLIDFVTHSGRHRVIAQAYVAEASLGDKRILMVNGEPIGGILRLHRDGVELNNLDAGGSAHPFELGERELAICASLKPSLINEGLYFCGIDILGDKLIEINVTSPTGLQELCRFSGKPFHHDLIAGLEI